jgi:2-polyprenyl-3-methyl-5-hydroxy-6-metoxy-1,4-benzoquinol methylase
MMTCTDFYASGDSFELFSCEDCSFTFTQGFPAGAAMNKYYENPGYIPHSDTQKGIINAAYHRVRQYMLGRKARLVTEEARRPSGKLLDIGTGTGYFPSTMAAKGWEVEATEKDAHARAFAKEKFDLDVKPEEALSTFEPETFDVITLWHVMEHLEKLNETWSRLYELLAPRGILIIAAPNHTSYDAGKYGANWAAYDVPRHLWHFTPATMQQFASKHGFIMAERYPMPFDAFYVSMLSEKNMKKPFPFLRGMYTGLLAGLGTLAKKERSSSMIYILRKKHNESQAK